MSKHERNRLWTLCLVAIIGFATLVWGANVAVQQHQRESLKTIGQLVSRSTQVPDGVDVHIVDLEGDTIRARDLRSHTVSGHAPKANTYDLIHIHGVPELVYRVRIDGELMAVTQRRQNLMTVAPALVVLATVIYWGIVIVLLGLRIRVDARLRRELDAIGESLEQMRQERVVQPVLVTKNSRLYHVARETQLLNDAMTSMRRHMRVRRTRFARLIDHLPQGVMLLNNDRNVVLSNPAFGDLLGCTVALTDHPYVDDVKEYELVHSIERVLAGHDSEHRELTLSQTGKTVDLTVVPIRDKAAVAQVLVILYDVTEIHHVEQMQADFVANVSHELKTPVTAISGFAETLQAGAKNDPETLDKFLTIIDQESKRLTTLINDILTLQRGQVTEEKQSFALKPMVQAVVDNLKLAADKRQVTIDVEIPDDLTVTSSQSRLTQIVRNLVDNAVFYNEDGGMVYIAATQTDGTLRLTVKDTGIGIPEADQQRVFERFYRVDKARSRNNGGTGLGLAITSEAVHALGGSIQLESQVGVGTTITVTL